MDSSLAARYDAVVIGAGHNGLVAAAYLAKAGHKVLVLERRSVLGGAAATEEVFPGYQVNTGSSDAGLFLPQIERDLELARHGLRWLQGPALVCALQPEGHALTLWRDIPTAQAEIARFSPADAGRYPDYLAWVTQAARVLQGILTRTPPALPALHAGELLDWLPAALRARRLGGRELMELLRVIPMPAADFLDEWFESPALKAALGYQGVFGGRLGPRASGTAFRLLYRAIGAGGGFRATRSAQGGAGELSAALAQAARQYGAEICSGVSVDRILLAGGRAAGVALSGGQEIAARAVLSSAAPRHTFFDLVGAPQLEVGFVRAVKNIRYRGGLARVNLALREQPQFNGLDDSRAEAALSGRVLLCPDLDVLERAADQAKYGALPTQPGLELSIPTLLDNHLAPPGQHLLCVDVTPMPYPLQTVDWEHERQKLGEQVIARLENAAPGISAQILHHQVITPLDLEREWGLPEGDIDHGEMALDQLLFMRPVPGWAQYRTPVGNLFLCGAGAHPGGGITGAPGYNAARAARRAL